MRIRNASLNDFDDIYTFLTELQNKTLDRSKLEAIFASNLQNTNNIYLVAEESAQIVGFISCHIQSLLHHAGNIAEIQEVFVTQEYRNRGIGKKLIEEVKRLTKERGALQLEVTTRAIRKEAIKFYKRESFEDSHKKLVFYY